jgi:hypothetical protein
MAPAARGKGERRPEGGDADAHDGADGGVGSGHWHLKVGRDEDPDGRAGRYTAHGEHEDVRIVHKAAGVDDLLLDRVGHVAAEEQCAEKLREECDDDGLSVRNCTGCNRSRK